MNWFKVEEAEKKKEMKEIEKEFLLSAKDGLVDDMKELLEKGAKMECRDSLV